MSVKVTDKIRGSVREPEMSFNSEWNFKVSFGIAT